MRQRRAAAAAEVRRTEAGGTPADFDAVVRAEECSSTVNRKQSDGEPVRSQLTRNRRGRAVSSWRRRLRRQRTSGRILSRPEAAMTADLVMVSCATVWRRIPESVLSEWRSRLSVVPRQPVSATMHPTTVDTGVSVGGEDIGSQFRRRVYR